MFIPDSVKMEARGLGGLGDISPREGRVLVLVVGGLEAVMRTLEVQGKAPRSARSDASSQKRGSQLTSFGERPRPAARKREWEVWEGRERKN